MAKSAASKKKTAAGGGAKKKAPAGGKKSKANGSSGAGGAKKKREPKKSFAYDGKTVIVAATLSDIKKAEQGKGDMDSKKLVRVPSKAVQAKLIEEAAKALAARESAALPSHGGRPWKCDVRLVEDGRKSKRKNTSALFRWYRGRLELAVLPHYYERIEEVDAGIGPRKRHRDDDPPSEDGADEDEEEDLYPHIPKTDLTQREVSALSTVAWHDPDHPIPDVKRTWRSPDLKTFNSRKAAIDHAKELLKRDKLIDKVLHGFGGHGHMCRPVKPTKKAALDAGLARFLRDGLWVVGQEEDWLEEALDVWKKRNTNREKREEREALEAKAEKAEAEFKKVATENDYDESGKEGAATNLLQEESTDSKIPAELGAGAGDGDGTSETSASSNPVAVDPGVISSSDSGTQGSAVIECEYTGSATSPNKKPPSPPAAKKQKTDSTADAPAAADGQPTANTTTEASAASADADNSSRMITPSPTSNDATAAPSSEATSSNGTAPEIQGSKVIDVHTTDDTKNEAKDEEKEAVEEKKVEEKVQKKKKPQGPRKAPKIAKSTHYRLTEKQIDACNAAVKEHYDKVMYTVKARNLFFELADGFDVLRERGRGRFDMELDAFDTPEFDFLTDLNKATWMPIVRKILGDDAILVHKGAFLSLPGAETQVYHQDGVHLNNKIQKPCHAVNVFIPLVDLDITNGPTEFCLGTHYLGYEGFVRDMCETPTPKAGTPLIFDYRLGHRGLGNSSPHSRPIVYLTYTPASNEFKDSVNFSRKRYKKLGELVDKPLSRSERALKRKREIEEESKKPSAPAKKISSTAPSAQGADQGTSSNSTTAPSTKPAAAASSAPTSAPEAPTAAMAAAPTVAATSTAPTAPTAQPATATVPVATVSATTGASMSSMNGNGPAPGPAIAGLSGIPPGNAAVSSNMAAAMASSAYAGVPPAVMASMMARPAGVPPAMPPPAAVAYVPYPPGYNPYPSGYYPAAVPPAQAAPSQQTGNGSAINDGQRGGPPTSGSI